jgi:hypothetical protein
MGAMVYSLLGGLVGTMPRLSARRHDHTGVQSEFQILLRVAVLGGQINDALVRDMLPGEPRYVMIKSWTEIARNRFGIPRMAGIGPIAEIKLRHEAAAQEAITKRSLGLSCWLFTSKAAIPSENPDC